MKLQHDFLAPDGTHFGAVRSVYDLLAEIPGAVDYWDAGPRDLTIDGSGRVTSWQGRSGERAFSQGNTGLRPVHSSRGLQFFNSETYEPDARLQLEGDPLGDPAAISIAVDAQIADGQTGVDQQTLWGNSQPPARLMYRSGNGGHLLLQWGGNVPPYIMTLPLPAGHAGRIRALMTISSTTVTLRVHDAVPVSMAYPGPVSLPLFYLASSSNSQITLRGYIRRFGIWKSSLTASEIETVMRWIS